MGVSFSMVLPSSSSYSRGGEGGASLSTTPSSSDSKTEMIPINTAEGLPLLLVVVALECGGDDTDAEEEEEEDGDNKALVGPCCWSSSSSG